MDPYRKRILTSYQKRVKRLNTTQAGHEDVLPGRHQPAPPERFTWLSVLRRGTIAFGLMMVGALVLSVYLHDPRQNPGYLEIAATVHLTDWQEENLFDEVKADVLRSKRDRAYANSFPEEPNIINFGPDSFMRVYLALKRPEGHRLP